MSLSTRLFYFFRTVPMTYKYLNRCARLWYQSNNTILKDFRYFHTSSIYYKKQSSKSKEKNIVIKPPNEGFLLDVYKDMKDLEDMFIQDLTRHFSLNVDLRVYENCNVTLGNDETHKMNHLGRITLKNPETVMINFTENPSAIKSAKTALQNSAICVNPQQDGVILYIPLPKASRERREQLATSGKKIFNDYKKRLDQSYGKYSNKNKLKDTDKDTIYRNEQVILGYKRLFESQGHKLLEEKQAAILKEIS